MKYKNIDNIIKINIVSIAKIKTGLTKENYKLSSTTIFLTLCIHFNIKVK